MAIGLIGFVKSECACWMGERCIGVDVFNRRFKKEGGCWVMEKKACPYFKTSVLPVAEQNYPEDYEQILKAYLKIDRGMDQDGLENARRCGCGAMLKKRQRCCPSCARKKNLANKRSWKSRNSKSRSRKLTKNAIS